MENSHFLQCDTISELEIVHRRWARRGNLQRSVLFPSWQLPVRVITAKIPKSEIVWRDILHKLIEKVISTVSSIIRICCLIICVYIRQALVTIHHCRPKGMLYSEYSDADLPHNCRTKLKERIYKTTFRRMEGRIYISVVIGDTCSHHRICSPDRCFVDTSLSLIHISEPTRPY